MKQAYSTDFLGTQPLRKLFWKLALPAVAAQLVTLIYNIVDRIYIGHLEGIGGLALTGLGVCTPLAIILSAFSQLICAGGAPTASILLGQGKKDDANRVMNSCFRLLIITGCVLITVMSSLSTPLLRLFGASDNTLPYAQAYFSWYIPGTLFMLISTGMILFLTAQGATGKSMLCVMSGALLNIALDPLFIFTFGLGIAGAAIATIISQAFSAGLVLAFLKSRQSELQLSFEKPFLHRRLLLSSLALGLSPFIMQITECLLSACFNQSLLRLGGDAAVGGMAIFTAINSAIFLPLSGISQGSQSITSYNYGAGKLDRVATNIKRLILVSLSYTTLMWAMVMLFPRFMPAIFTSDDAVLSYAESHIRVFFAMTWIFGLQCACQNSFLALRNAKVSLFLALYRKIVLLIPLIFILPCVFPQLGDSAVLMAEPVADTIAATTTTCCFFILQRKILFGNRKENR